MENVIVILADLPVSIRAYTICDDGYYTIVLNDNIGYMQRRKAYAHELEHIIGNDFEKDMPVGMIELFAHQNK